MKRIRVASVAFLLAASACLGGGGGDDRRVFVDFNHDEFSSIMMSNFPKELRVTPGESIEFQQIWTGEPHTVTGGAEVNEMMADAVHTTNLVEGFEGMAASGVDLPNPDAPDAPEGSWADLLETIENADDEANRELFLDAYDGLIEEGADLPPRDEPGDASTAEVFSDLVDIVDASFENSPLPWAAEEDEDGNYAVTQNAGQPCYLEEGLPPKDPNDACDEDDQDQPEFDGTASYYNSGIIPYEGAQGNTFRVDLANDIEPGDYFFYCAVHGPMQSTKVTVEPEGTEVPSAEAVNRRARSEIADFAAPMLRSFRDARDGSLELDGETIEGPFAGITTDAPGAINEFVPKVIRTEVGEPVTWKVMGWDHTISFDVPEYFPVVCFPDNAGTPGCPRRGGRISLNSRLFPPAGGAPDLPEELTEGGPPEDGAPPEGPPEIISVDGGTYDGDGFFSSGLFSAEPYAEYTLRFSEPGTYKYACLLHPPMVGTVEVT